MSNLNQKPTQLPLWIPFIAILIIACFLTGWTHPEMTPLVIVVLCPLGVMLDLLFARRGE